MRALIIMSVIALSGCAANGEWTRRDTIMEVTWQAVNVLDAVSTSRLEDTPDWHLVERDGVTYRRRLEEHSPLTRAVIGPRPSSEDVYMWMTTVAISHWLIARALPPKWRPWYQGVSIAVSAEAFLGNCDNGLC